MNIQEQLTADLKSAMLARDAEKAETLRGLKSAILYEEVSLKKRETGLSDDELIAVLKRESKKRVDAIELYTKGGRDSSADKEQQELALIKTYLPETLGEEATVSLIDQAMSDLGIDTPQRSDMGKIIGAVKAKAGAAADPALIAKLVSSKIK